MKATKRNITLGIILSILLMNPRLRTTKMKVLLAELLTTNTGAALKNTLGSWPRVNNIISQTNTAKILGEVGDNSLQQLPGLLYNTTPGHIGNASYRILSDVGLDKPLDYVLKDIHNGLSSNVTEKTLKAASDTSLKSVFGSIRHGASVSGN
jgi:hypothetical protein